MKNFFRLVSMLAVAGLAFAYTSCTDYSKDIDENSKEIDAVSSELATAKQQIESMKTDISNLQTAKSEAEKAIAALQTSLSTLQTKHDADVKALREEYAAADGALKEEIQKKIDALQKAHETEVGEIKSTIENLQKSVTELQDKVKSIEDVIATLATKQDLSDAKTWVNNTFVTKDTMKVVNATLGALETRLANAENKISALEGKYDEDIKISEILDKIDDAKNAAKDAMDHSLEVLGQVESFKKALGVYADSGKLVAKIEALEAKDTELADSLNQKFNSRDFSAEFKKEFTTAFETAIKEAVENDGVVGKAIAQVDSARVALENSIEEFKTVVNAKFDYLYAVAKQLKSLVFVPDLYVDGIEATEYTYAKYNIMVLQSPAKDTEYTEYGDGKTTIKAIVPKDQWLFKDYARYTANPLKGSVINRFMDPASVVTYKMNPSTADVTAETPLALITDDKEYIKTRNSVNEGTFVRFVSAEDGELKVEFDAKSFEENRERVTNQNTLTDLDNTSKNKVSIFALQATVKNGEDQDTTITSDFARLYISNLSFENLAFTKADYTSTIYCGTQDHIYSTLKDAIENAPSVNLLYNGAPLDLDDVVTTHYFITRYVNGKDVKSFHKDYDADRAAGTIDNFNVKYEFLPIDYLLGDNKTSETQHLLFVDKSKVVACNVTDGKQDPSLTGDKARQSVGRRPIVMVKMTVNGELVKIGFIKFEIREQLEYKVADEFDWAFRFHCGGYENQSTWGQMVDKILKVTGDTRETFSKNFALKVDANKHAVQYFKVGNDFVSEYDLTAAQMKALGITVKHFGTVTEILDNNVIQPGTTTSTLNWRIGLEDMSRIYSRNGHKVTVWVLYESTTVTNTTKYDGIYVPLTAEVKKPVSSVSKKMPEYWFNNLASAKINVDIPKATKEVDPTKPWKTDINNVWEGNKPQFDDLDKKYQNEADIEYKYKYYFAPVQETYPIDGLYYMLYVDYTNMFDSVLGKNVTTNGVTNKQVPTYELNNNVTVDPTIKKSIYANSDLYCTVYTKNEPKAANIYKDKDGNEYRHLKIATINQETGVVTYNYDDGVLDSKVAKFLLNAYESNPTTEYAEAKLLAKIGVTAFVEGCDVAMPLKDAINDYHFLRPVNAVATATESFVDSKDAHLPESNIDLLKLFTFKDWKGDVFYKEPADDAEPDYSNLWYFKYYHVKSVYVGLDMVTTTLSGGKLGDTENSLLSQKTKKIVLEYRSKADPTFVSKVDALVPLNIALTTDADPDKWAVNAAEKYDWVVKYFGYLHYHNNGTPTSDSFQIRVPVSFTYTWGTIDTYVDITVNNRK